MRVRAGVLAFSLVAALGIAGLVVAAASKGRSTAWSLDIPPSVAVIVLQSGQSACQGPMTTRAAVGSVQTWITPSTASGAIPQGPVPGAAIDLTVRDAATNRAVARGQIAAGYVRAAAPIVQLDRTIPSGRRIEVCFHSRGPGSVDLMGAPLPNDALVEDDGTASGSRQAAIALLFLRPHPRSVLSLVPTIFARASLFRPSWVGPWTYSVLSAAFLGAFALGGVALARAARSDAASDAHRQE